MFIGSTRNNIGYLSIKIHRKFKEPKSIYIKKQNGRYSVSLAFDDGIDESGLNDQKAFLKVLSQYPQEDLERITIGIDRGVVRPVQAGKECFDFTPEQKRNKREKEKYLKRLQRRLSKQKKVPGAETGPKRKLPGLMKK